MTVNQFQRVGRLRTLLHEQLRALEIAQQAAEERLVATKAALDSLQAELQNCSNLKVFDTRKIVIETRARLYKTREGMRELVSIIGNDKELIETVGPEILRIMRRMERKLLT
jgi:hypothetical protein